MDGVVVDIEGAFLGVRERERVESGHFEVHYSLTGNAHQMMMAIGLRVEACSGAWAADFDGEPELHESVEHAVDGRAGHFRQARANLLQNLVGSRVVLPCRQGFQNHTALHGERQAVVPTRGFQRGQFPGYLFRSVQRADGI